jgi:hypothetical protein
MNSKEIFDGVIKGCFFGLAGMYAVAGLVCSAGFMSSLTPAYGTNYLVTAIVFYGIPGVIDRIDCYFAEKVQVKSVSMPAKIDVSKFFAKETSYPGIGGNNRSIPVKKKKMRKTVSKKIK